MDRIILISNLTGNYKSFDSPMYDCYIRENIGIFIPICDDLDNKDLKHNHPSRKFIQAWKANGIEHLLQIFRMKNCEAVTWTMETNFEKKEPVQLCRG